jgi:gamma-glutamylcyclotransferase (GGCT)/AIG2-like uncharacterized protein YtfP
MHVFVYGTLLDPLVFRRMAGTLRPLRCGVPARLPGHRRVPLRGTPYPTLLRAPGEVEGRVILLSRDVMKMLSAYEGASYRLVPVTVVTRRGPCRAKAWMASPWRADARHDWSLPVRQRAGM